MLTNPTIRSMADPAVALTRANLFRFPMRFLPLLALLLSAGLHAAEPLDAFPEAADGRQRHVIQLDTVDQEELLQVELLIGKTIETDPRNRYFFGGKLEERVVEGMGYTYYYLDQLGPMAGTLMAVPPDTRQEERFVTTAGDPFLVRYNSRLPLVIDVPEGVEVRYRIWRGDQPTLPADQG